MGAEGGQTMAERPLHNRASAAAESPQTAPDLRAIEIGRWEKRARDIRIGLRNLTEIERRGVLVESRRMMLGAKLSRVEARIYRLKQGRLF